MLLVLALAAALVSVCNGKPYDIGPQNVVTVPPNCPSGQEWIAGACRDVWRIPADTSNVVTVPPNCLDGQEYVNGECRDVWYKNSDVNVVYAPSVNAIGPHNMVQVPANCRPGQQWINGACREVWRLELSPQNVVTVPPNCPEGQEYVNGQCRDVWRKSSNPVDTIMQIVNELNALMSTKDVNTLPEANDDRNVISVPSQCPAGFRPDALGVCREIFNFDK